MQSVQLPKQALDDPCAFVDKVNAYPAIVDAHEWYSTKGLPGADMMDKKYFDLVGIHIGERDAALSQVRMNIAEGIDALPEAAHRDPRGYLENNPNLQNPTRAFVERLLSLTESERTQ